MKWNKKTNPTESFSNITKTLGEFEKQALSFNEFIEEYCNTPQPLPPEFLNAPTTAPLILIQPNSNEGVIRQVCLGCHRQFLSKINLHIIEGEPVVVVKVSVAMMTKTGNCMFCDPNYQMEPLPGDEYQLQTSPLLVPSVN